MISFDFIDLNFHQWQCRIQGLHPELTGPLFMLTYQCNCSYCFSMLLLSLLANKKDGRGVPSILDEKDHLTHLISLGIFWWVASQSPRFNQRNVSISVSCSTAGIMVWMAECLHFSHSFSPKEKAKDWSCNLKLTEIVRSTIKLYSNSNGSVGWCVLVWKCLRG